MTPLRAVFAGLFVAAFVVTAKWLLGPVDQPCHADVLLELANPSLVG